jgi:hypothetical protein
VPLISATDLQGMLEAVGGVPITAGAISGVGVYKKNHKIIFDEDAVILEHSLRARSDQFGHLKYGDSLVVFDANAANGVFFKVKQEPMQINSGQDCIIELARTTAISIPLVSRLLRTGSGQLLVTGSGRSLQTQPS